jgi:hypothetical protein
MENAYFGANFPENIVYFSQKFSQKRKNLFFAKNVAKVSLIFSKPFTKTKISC